MTPGGTIAARATATGASPRAIVRLSGSLDDLNAIFTQPLPRVRGAIVAHLMLGDGVMLPVLAAVAVAPASYTGEDCVDLIIPGGPAIIERVLRALTRAPGVRHAEAGEFTARAYASGRIDLEQAKAVAATIAAESEQELAAARGMADSARAGRTRGWNEALSQLLALVEAGIDFADQEDVVAIARERLAGELAALASDISSHLASAMGAERRTGVPRVVLVGAPSAGKSTLFNAMLGRRRSVVHESPGTTRDAIAEELPLPGGGRIELVDLAGLDDAAGDGLSAEIQRRARGEIDRADAIVLCDPSGHFRDAPNIQIPTLRVRTKADLPAAAGVEGDVSVCALDGWRLDELRARIASLVGVTGVAAGGAIAARVDAALRHACAHLNAAITLTRADVPRWELIAGEMRLALDQLGVVGGRIDPDDVLGLIFRTFCIGK